MLRVLVHAHARRRLVSQAQGAADLRPGGAAEEKGSDEADDRTREVDGLVSVAPRTL